MSTDTAAPRPDFATDEMLKFLDDLRESGARNIWGAGPYLEREFPELAAGKKANTVLGYWMKSFPREPHL